jgi:hypothetical protein
MKSLTALFALVAVACSSSPPGSDAGSVCTPGTTQACMCSPGVSGVQSCNAAGTGYDTCASCEALDSGQTDTGQADTAPTDPLVGTWAAMTLTGQDTSQGFTSINVTLTLNANLTFTDSIVVQYGASAPATLAGCSQTVQASGTWNHDTMVINLSPSGGNVTQATSGCTNPANDSTAMMRPWGAQPTYDYTLGTGTLTLSAVHTGYDFLNRTFIRQ